MELLEAMQKAIDFIEAHLEDKITYEDVANEVYMSCFHFHRLFSMLTGITPSEYIRNRRLSIAGQELMRGKGMVTDLAYKYGYETPESFSRAFMHFHGVNPSKAAKSTAHESGCSLTLFNRLHLKITYEGGFKMDYRIENRKAFSVLALTKDFPIDAGANAEDNQIPAFFQKFYKQGFIKTVDELALQNENAGYVYGVCSPTGNKCATFSYGIGKICSKDMAIPEKLPKYVKGTAEGFMRTDIADGKWAAFPCYGEDGACIAATWQAIFKEFLPSSPYKMRETNDFEVYPPDGRKEAEKRGHKGENLFCEIWIPIAEK